MGQFPRVSTQGLSGQDIFSATCGSTAPGASRQEIDSVHRLRLSPQRPWKQLRSTIDLSMTQRIVALPRSQRPCASLTRAISSSVVLSPLRAMIRFSALAVGPTLLGLACCTVSKYELVVLPESTFDVSGGGAQPAMAPPRPSATTVVLNTRRIPSASVGEPHPGNAARAIARRARVASCSPGNNIMLPVYRRRAD
jgi:hypothetical protein